GVRVLPRSAPHGGSAPGQGLRAPRRGPLGGRAGAGVVPARGGVAALYTPAEPGGGGLPRRRSTLQRVSGQGVLYRQPQGLPPRALVLPRGAGASRAVAPDRGIPAGATQARGMARPALRRGQAVARAAPLPSARPGEGQYRGHADRRRAAPQTLAQRARLGPPSVARGRLGTGGGAGSATSLCSLFVR